MKTNGKDIQGGILDSGLTTLDKLLITSAIPRMVGATVKAVEKWGPTDTAYRLTLESEYREDDPTEFVTGFRCTAMDEDSTVIDTFDYPRPPSYGETGSAFAGLVLYAIRAVDEDNRNRYIACLSGVVAILDAIEPLLDGDTIPKEFLS